MVGRKIQGSQERGRSQPDVFMVTRHGRMLSGNGGSVGGRQPQGLDSRLFVQAHFIDGTVGIRRSRVQEHAFRKRSEELLSMCGGRTRFLEGVRVVVVDDSPDIRKSMGTLLALWGAEVRSCATSGEAEALLGEGGASRSPDRRPET